MEGELVSFPNIEGAMGEHDRMRGKSRKMMARR
jgi:hypothetical protein